MLPIWNTKADWFNIKRISLFLSINIKPNFPPLHCSFYLQQTLFMCCFFWFFFSIHMFFTFVLVAIIDAYILKKNIRILVYFRYKSIQKSGDLEYHKMKISFTWWAACIRCKLFLLSIIFQEKINKIYENTCKINSFRFLFSLQMIKG